MSLFTNIKEFIIFHEKRTKLHRQASEVAPYNPQQILQPPYTPMLNYITLVQPGYPYQQMTPPTLPSNIQDLSPMAGDGTQYPFLPSHGFSSAPGGAVMANLNYFSSESYVKF
ncbi:hypothetical protein GRJ2_002411000 [Grus japonensis]|uniref:Uncharacterized protein n=1 Tax=Grus japonensis TaxID=30415 RepID=A0ABC9XPU0_GRUJA